MAEASRIMTQPERQILRIEPVDTLFFRDARPFGEGTRATSGIPRPQTIAGAIRTAMLRWASVDLEIVARGVQDGATFANAASAVGPAGAAIGDVRFSGPWFGQGQDVFFKSPATLRSVRGTDEIVRLDPLNADLPGWSPPLADMKPLWRKGRQRLEAVSDYLSANEMERFLNGGVPRTTVRSEELYGFDDRTGIGLDPQRSVVAEGMIYSTRMLALRPGTCLFAELTGPSQALALLPATSTLLALGGEGRRAIVERVANCPRMPQVKSAASATGDLLVLTAPALLNQWNPANLPLLAAAVPGYEAISGWDLARGGPKPNRFAVPAGSVYFLKPGAEFPANGCLAAEEDAKLGWGTYLKGTWNYAA